ncbi:MAG: tetratricopeptide repeat protein [Gammaproteobacteria bacterium]|nr:tetratricopeptide repeat protein [Gammaproteobacteria bacterium]NNF60592.1 tetratricopeptide repeat protein [Gammaproteobacteria bacterium]
MTERPLRIIISLALCLLIAATGCSESQPVTGGVDARDTVRPIPFPDLDRLETASRKQLEEMYERVAALEKSSPDSQLLAKAYGELGKIFHSHELNDAAEVSYRNAELLAPDDYRWTYYRAHLFRKAGKTSIAIRGLQRVIELMKQDVTAEPQQFVAALTWLGDLYQVENDYDNARLMYEQAKKINPSAMMPVVALAQVDAAEGDHASAIEALEAIKEAASDATIKNLIHYQLAMSYRAVGKNDQARELLQGVGDGGRATVSDPLLKSMHQSAVNATRLVRQGNRAFESGRVGAAIELYREALEIDPQSSFARARLARAMDWTGKTEEAVSMLESAIEINPDAAVLRGTLSRLYRRQGDMEQARAAIETALELEPDNITINLDYGQLLMDYLNRPDDALGVFEFVLEREPASVRAHAGRAAALRRTAGCGAALNALEQSHSALPDSHLLADGLARTLLQCESEPPVTRVMTLAQQAFDADRQSWRYAGTVAMAHAAAGDFDSAVSVQQQAIELARSAGTPTQRLETVLQAYSNRQKGPAAAPE